MATIQFGGSSAALGQRERGVLGDVAALHRERGGRVHVVGHASGDAGHGDPARRERANYAMSEQRARTVAETLAGLGVPRDRIVVTAAGDSQPRFYESGPTGAAGNRRVEVFFTN